MTDEEIFDRKISKIVNSTIIDFLDEFTSKMQDKYKSCIQDFYKHYKRTRYYDRTYSLFAASDYYNDGQIYNGKYHRQSADGGYIAGIKIDPLYYLFHGLGNPYRAGASWVFPRSFEEGIHGLTPDESESLGLSWRKKPLYPSPKNKMDKFYKKMIKKKTLDKIFNEELSKNINRYLK